MYFRNVGDFIIVDFFTIKRKLYTVCFIIIIVEFSFHGPRTILQVISIPNFVHNNRNSDL